MTPTPADDVVAALAEARAEIARLKAMLGDWPLVDPLEIERTGKRWHGEEHRVFSVRFEPYKPDGVRQTGVKGRWQEMIGSGDYWRWSNCDRPAALRDAREGR